MANGTGAPGGGWGQVAAADLAGISAQTEHVRGKVASGALRFDPEAARQAAQAYERAQLRLARLARNVDKLRHVTAFGEYASAGQLGEKFARKAADPAVGAASLLVKVADELQRKAELFRLAAAEYADRDGAIADELNSGGR